MLLQNLLDCMILFKVKRLVVFAYLEIGTPSCWQVFVRFDETLTPSGILNLVKLEINLKKFPNI